VDRGQIHDIECINVARAEQRDGSGNDARVASVFVGSSIIKKRKDRFDAAAVGLIQKWSEGFERKEAV